MKDLLPDASIGLTVPASQFFDEIVELAAKGGEIMIERDDTTLSSFGQTILNLDFKGTTPHQGLFGQLIARGADERVRVEVRASQWDGDSHPSYTTYFEALQLVFRGLLKAYNQRHQSRYRLAIASQESCEPTLSPKTREAFDSFLAMANKNGLHPLDWDRYYRFCNLCHVYRVQTNESDIQSLLEKAGFDESYSWELASIYSHLRRYSEIC